MKFFNWLLGGYKNFLGRSPNTRAKGQKHVRRAKGHLTWSYTALPTNGVYRDHLGLDL